MALLGVLDEKLRKGSLVWQQIVLWSSLRAVLDRYDWFPRPFASQQRAFEERLWLALIAVADDRFLTTHWSQAEISRGGVEEFNRNCLLNAQKPNFAGFLRLQRCRALASVVVFDHDPKRSASCKEDRERPWVVHTVWTEWSLYFAGKRGPTRRRRSARVAEWVCWPRRARTRTYPTPMDMPVHLCINLWAKVSPLWENWPRITPLCYFRRTPEVGNVDRFSSCSGSGKRWPGWPMKKNKRTRFRPRRVHQRSTHTCQ